MDSEIGIEKNHDNQEANKLSSFQSIQNDKTLNLNINEQNIDLLPSTGQTIFSPIQIEQHTSINHNIQADSYTEKLNPKPVQYGINNDLEQDIQTSAPKIIDSSELAAESHISGNPLQSQQIESNIIYNNNSLYGSYYNSQSNPIGQPQSEFIESQAIYGQKQSQFVESQEIYAGFNVQPKYDFIESQAIYNVPQENQNHENQIEDIMNAKIEFYEPRQNINKIPIQEPSSNPEIIVNENDIRNEQNLFSSLKVSKTKYLSKEELENIMESQENNNNNDNINNQISEQVEPVQSTFPVNTIEQPENVYSTTYINNNIELTNDKLEENKIVASNNLGNDELIKMPKTLYSKDENNANYNEEIIEPPLDKEIGNENNTKILKIEDVEDGCCPGLKCWNKLLW